MTTWVIGKNAEGTEWSCTSRENWDSAPIYSHDGNGVPFQVVEEFQSESAESAFAHYEDVMQRRAGR